MKEWNESDFLDNECWYHSTSEVFLRKILKEGIKADVNKESELDFGYGFYLSASLEWARKYARGFNNARILVFNFKPIYILKNNNDYKFYGNLNTEFADFVFANRMYYSNYESKCVHNYDIVAGVMSDGTQAVDFEEYRNQEISKEELYRRLLLPREDWQLTIHSQKLCDKIIPCKAYDLKGVEYDVSKLYKTN